MVRREASWTLPERTLTTGHAPRATGAHPGATAIRRDRPRTRSRARSERLDEPAVDDDVGARHVRDAVAAEEADEVGDLLRRRDPPRRGPRHRRALDFVGRPAGGRG